MGSAPVRRGFETLLGSSVRRGSPVGPGMSGVYRVRRTRTVQAPALGRARSNPNAWVQPPDQDGVASVHFVAAAVNGNFVTVGGFAAESLEVIAGNRGVSVGGTTRDTTRGVDGADPYRPFAGQTNLVIPLPVPGTVDPTDYGYPVPGDATGWEFETPNGTVIGTPNVTGDIFNGPASLRLVSDAAWDDPSTNDGLDWFTPGELTGFTELLPIVWDTTVTALEFPWGPQGAVINLSLQALVHGDSWTAFDGFTQVLWDDRIGFEPVVAYSWRPPRFRFTF